MCLLSGFISCMSMCHNAGPEETFWCLCERFLCREAHVALGPIMHALENDGRGWIVIGFVPFQPPQISDRAALQQAKGSRPRDTGLHRDSLGSPGPKTKRRQKVFQGSVSNEYQLIRCCVHEVENVVAPQAAPQRYYSTP